MDNSSLDVEAVDDVVLQNFDYFHTFDLSEGDILCLLGEVISYLEDKLMYFFFLVVWIKVEEFQLGLRNGLNIGHHWQRWTDMNKECHVG